MAAKNSDATNLTNHFKGESYSLEGGMTPLNNLLGKYFFTWTDEVNVIINSAEIIWIFAVDNSNNAYPTEK